jgi:glucose-1-phosphate thymidylyltransferase
MSRYRRAAKAVILAGGLGKRMRSETAEVSLTAEQKAVADAGAKAMVPLADGRSLLELSLANLNAAGFAKFVIVVGTESKAIREHCAKIRLDINFAVQERPLGTANALLAAESSIDDGELFGVFNSDNLYPVAPLRELVAAGKPAMLAFERTALIERGNISEERIAKFASVETDADGSLKKIVEKPERVEPDALISMNAWVFSPKIFAACHAVSPSVRGEYELTSAAEYLVGTLGENIAAIRAKAGVLDLSSRADIVGIGKFIE